MVKLENATASELMDEIVSRYYYFLVECMTKESKSYSGVAKPKIKGG